MTKVSVEIKKSTFKRLQENSVPLVDSIDDIINDALNALEVRKGQGTSKNTVKEADRSHSELVIENSNLPAMEVTANNLPELTFTKVLEATIDGQNLVKPNWNSIMYNLVEMSADKGFSIQDLRMMFSLNLTSGKHPSSKSYTYIPNLGVSIHPKSARESCNTITKIARKLGISINIEFMWRKKRGALHPGRRARLRI